MDKVTIAIFAAVSILISWLLPHHYYPWLTGNSEFAAFLAVITLSLILFNRDHPILLPRAATLLAITAAIPLIQWSTGIIFFSGDALIVSCYLVGFAAVVMVGYNLTADTQLRNHAYQALATVFIVGAVLSTWIAIRQWLGLVEAYNTFEAAIPYNSGLRPFANFGQPNNLATLLCMGIASTLYLFEQRRIGTIASGILTAFLLFGVVLTQSRTPWVGAIFVLVWWVWKSRYFNARLQNLSVAGWVAAYALLVVSLPFITKTLGLGSIDLVGHAESFQRISLWKQFILAVLHGPLWGYGWNQVSVAQVDISSLFPVAIMTNSSHNILLDLLVWNGPVLGTVMILLMSIWLCRLAYSARSASSVCALLAVGFAMIHGMLEYPLEYAYFLLPVGLLIGMVDGEQKAGIKSISAPVVSPIAEPSVTPTLYPETAMLSLAAVHSDAGYNTTSNAAPMHPVQRRFSQFIALFPDFSLHVPPALFAGFLLLAIVFMVNIAHEYSALNQDYRIFHAPAPAVTKAGSTPPLAANPAKQIILLTQLRDDLRLQSINPTPQMTAQQLAWAREVAYRYPQIINLSRYAEALALNNQPIEAGQQLSELRILYGDAVATSAAEALAALEQQYANFNTQLSITKWRCIHQHKNPVC